MSPVEDFDVVEEQRGSGGKGRGRARWISGWVSAGVVIGYRGGNGLLPTLGLTAYAFVGLTYVLTISCNKWP